MKCLFPGDNHVCKWCLSWHNVSIMKTRSRRHFLYHITPSGHISLNSYNRKVYWLKWPSFCKRHSKLVILVLKHTMIWNTPMQKYEFVYTRGKTSKLLIFLEYHNITVTASKYLLWLLFVNQHITTFRLPPIYMFFSLLVLWHYQFSNFLHFRMSVFTLYAFYPLSDIQDQFRSSICTMHVQHS